jgi:hypothetical protein
MIRKLFPIVLLLFGSGAGVGAGIFLRPTPVPEDTTHESVEGEAHDATSQAGHAQDEDAPESEMDYAKLNNQFVVPIVKGDKMVALVVLALSIEVPLGRNDDVFQREPKLRDSFLQVLFDHANIGGFDGAFTEAGTLETLRKSLREVAQKDLGKDLAKDVLILEIARQDY